MIEVEKKYISKMAHNYETYQTDPINTQKIKIHM